MSKKLSLARLIKNTALILLCLLPIAALGSRFNIWPYSLGLALFAAALVGGLALQVICALWLIQKPQPQYARPLRQAALFSLPALIIIAFFMRETSSGMPLHDVSTDTSQPPLFDKAILLRGDNANSLVYTAAKAQIQARLHPELSPINTPFNKQKNYTLALASAQQLGWQVHHHDAQLGIIEAVDSTLWFGFKDDIVIRTNNQRVDIRSVSRVGKSDLGTNAKRIGKFISHFQTLASD
ncbi:DUF1499 domain-containing protein [Dasania sp. GY-MA-18]|uniref:DUF1499 domain-containing protein n=1 Tax=Dasania phycosphaerae TaxID=2950436 RepID=A0A9J6RHW3_9GAMM|nr:MULTISPECIES: DUF1499 domain-containing protein [Dasania]MCR8921161.1 DUF1499 domain-containing protein [Dasania sp. GY-MA-18]MCZ0863589.1 DUF1499 domain-containing protein [Dasania phycosphaerae]MCZ0867317.1 DUF1499 domain-containing protein [Dasania phycosphaerae]